MVRWMNKKPIKILTVILIIGISVPVVATGANNQEQIMTFFSQNILKSDLKETQNDMLYNGEFGAELEKAKYIPDEAFTLQGKWGIYNKNIEGIFKGFEEKNKIYGKALYKNEKVYFYLDMNKYLRTFNGMVIYNDDFHLISGDYIKKNEKFIALWTCENIDGWLAGELL
jgi:hypothetical protein